MAQEQDGVWRTVGGRRIFIANGQSLSDAMAKSGKFKGSKTKKSKSKLSQKQQSKVRKTVKDMVDKMRKRDGYSDEEIREIIEDEGIMSNDALYEIEGAEELGKEIEKEAMAYFNSYLDDGGTKSDYKKEVRKEVKDMVDTLRSRDGYSDSEIREMINDEGIMSNDALHEIKGASRADIEKEAMEYFNAYLDDGGETKTSTKSDYESQLSKISSIKEDGTFDLATGKAKEYQDGYQVTFSMTEMGFSDEEYTKLVDQFKQADHGTIDAGKFGGEPEISFNVTDIKKAGKLAYKYNQVSIWDWKNNKEIKTGGTGKWSNYKKKGE